MAGSLASINIKFFADLKDFSSKMQNANRSLKKYGKQMTAVGKGLSIGVTLPILAMGAASIKAASDAKETASKFNVVFSDISKAAQDSANILRNSYGLSSQASKKLLGDTGDLLTGFGFSQQSALDLSTEVNKLAVDLASFTNFSGGAAGASAALTKALLGERESVKSLGISILEADVKARVLLNTKQGLTFETERQAKAYATLQLAQEQSKNAIGDYERTNQSFANQMRLVKARISDLSVEFGEILLPYATKLTVSIGKLTSKFSNLSPATKKIIVVIAGLAAVIGPLLVALGFLMTTVIPGLITAFTFLSATVLPAVITGFNTLTAAILANPIGLLAAAIGAIVFAFTTMIQKITPAVSKLKTFFNLVRSGGNHVAFLNYQMADQLAVMDEENKAAEAAAKAAAKFASDQEFAALATKKLTEELLKQNKVITGGGGDSRSKVSNISTTTAGVDKNVFKNIPEGMKVATDLAGEYLIGFQKKLTVFQESAGMFSVAVSNSFGALASNMIASLETGNIFIDAFVSTILNSLKELGEAFIRQLVIEKIFAAGKKSIDFGKSSSNAVVIASSAAAAMGPAGIIALPALIASQLAVISGAFAGIAAFATGGIVGGTSFYGDKLLALVNSGEAIFNRDQQKTLYNMVQSDSNVQMIPYIAETRISGADLKVILKRQNNRDNRTN